MKHRSTKPEFEGLDSKPLRELKYFICLSLMYHFFFFFIPFSFHFKWWLFFFLKQGEYIAPEKIQNAYLRSPFVAHAFVIGNSFEALKLNSSLNKHILPFQSFLVAVIVPDAEVIEAWAKKMKWRETWNSFVKMRLINLQKGWGVKGEGSRGAGAEI